MSGELSLLDEPRFPLANDETAEERPIMDQRETARREFKRIVAWIVVIAALVATGAIIYLALTGDLHLHMVIATLGGVFLSVVLGSGLMAAAFFSDKSGHDQNVTDCTSTSKDDAA